MVISKEYIDLVILLATNISKITFVGGIVDYYYFDRHHINAELSVGDIDIRIWDLSVIDEIENLLNSKCVLYRDDNGVNRYYVKLNNGTRMDVFYRTDSLGDVEVNLFGVKMKIETIDRRKYSINEILEWEFIDRPTNPVVFKYIKKKILYTLIS